MKDAIAVIRDRYQLTIPEEIRRYLVWTGPQRVVRLILVSKNKFLVEPYRAETMSWQRIWQNLEKIKSLGRKTSLAEFIIADRTSH